MALSPLSRAARRRLPGGWPLALGLAAVLCAGAASAQGLLAGEKPEPEPALAMEPESRLGPGLPPAAAWAAHGLVGLVPIAEVLWTPRLGADGLKESLIGAAVGAAGAAYPSRLLFLHPIEGGRWRDLDVLAFSLGVLLTPAASATAVWATGELAFTGSPRRGEAFVGALAGAAAGTLATVVFKALLELTVGDEQELEALRWVIGFGLVGATSSLGYQWARARGLP